MKRKHALRAALSIVVCLLAACGSSQSPTAGTDTAGGGTSFPERNQYPFGLACGWEVASNIDLMNIFYPDAFAKYWVALVPVLPGTHLRIDGHYPDVRYFSFNVYDPLLRPTDAVADNQLAPNGAGLNPFATEGAPYGDTYTAYVAFTARPETPAPNTLYAGQFPVGDASLPQPLLTALIYRTYVPADDKDFDGGVGLPVLTLETADGAIELLPTADCVEPLLPTLGGAFAELGLNDTLIGIDVYDDPLLLTQGAIPLGTADSETHIFRGVPEFYLTFVAELLNLPFVPGAVDSVFPSLGGGGFLSNIHNAYAYNIYFRTKGNVILLRAKAPTFRTQPGVPFGTEQLRYWSVCQNEVATQRYVGCLHDDQVVLDDDGFFTVIVSDTADRPDNATAENQLNWLPWGPYADAGLLYRHMLPDPGFVQTISNVPRGGSVAEVMGDYAPQAAYCTREIVEAAGNDPAAVFAACRQYTEGL